jgi:hypothetical protein
LIEKAYEKINLEAIMEEMLKLADMRATAQLFLGVVTSDVEYLKKMLNQSFESPELENALKRFQIMQGDLCFLVDSLDEIQEEMNLMESVEQEKIPEIRSGDIIRIKSYEQNCGIDEGSFTALVVESKDLGLIAIPQDFLGRFHRQAEAGASWELEVSWLLENDIEIEMLERFDDLMDRKWGVSI